MSEQDESRVIEASEDDVEEVPFLDPALQEQNREQFAQALQTLDARGQRIVGQLLAGARARGAAERLSKGEVEVLSSGIVTAVKRGDAVRDGASTGEAMRAALRLAGIDETYLANVLQEGIRASRPVVAKGRVRKVPDYAVRLRYLELAHRLRGDFADAQASGPGPDAVAYEERLRLYLRGDD